MKWIKNNDHSSDNERKQNQNKQKHIEIQRWFLFLLFCFLGYLLFIFVFICAYLMGHLSFHDDDKSLCVFFVVCHYPKLMITKWENKLFFFRELKNRNNHNDDICNMMIEFVVFVYKLNGTGGQVEISWSHLSFSFHFSSFTGKQKLFIIIIMNDSNFVVVEKKKLIAITQWKVHKSPFIHSFLPFPFFGTKKSF